MKKWIVPVLFFALIMSTTQGPANALWPFKKHDDNAKKETKAVDITNGKTDAEADAEAAEQEEVDEEGDLSEDAAKSNPAGPPPGAQQEAQLPKVQVKSPLSDEIEGLKVEEPVDSTDLPPDKSYVAIDDPKNPLGITTSAQKLNESAQLISQKKYKDAQGVLNPLKDWLVDATEAHINLYKTLKNIPSAQVQAELEKQLALQFALLRDKAFFQLGMLSVGQQDYAGAVRNLSKVIQSQPRSPMGAQAYDVLQKIGFTEKMQLREEKQAVQQPVTQ